MSLHDLLEPLLRPAFHLGSVPTSRAELLGFVAGGAAEHLELADRHCQRGPAGPGVPGRRAALWHERYLGSSSPQVEQMHERTPHHLWILTDVEGVPFEQDG